MNNYSAKKLNYLCNSYHVELVEKILKRSVDIGASDCFAMISENHELSVSTRNGDIETVEQASSHLINMTVYSGQRYGSASTSDFSELAIEETINIAWNLACQTAVDSAAGLPDVETLATQFPNLQLYCPWSIDIEQAKRIAALSEESALDIGSDIVTDGAQVSTNEGQFFMGNTLGFRGGFLHSSHNISIVVIAQKEKEMQRDYWYTSNRNPLLLTTPEKVGKIAANRARARLGARRIETGSFPVIFEAPVALSLLGNFTQAASGGALYRKASFLNNSLGKKIFSRHIEIVEDPHIFGGMGSCAFDDEGVYTERREIVRDGVLQSYFLSTYTGRKLGMKTTGNAGGAHNLVLRSNQTKDTDDLDNLIKQMGTGLLVTELIGQGVNYITGDYSRGVSGFWIQNGKIQYAVQEITIAGNLLDMFQNVEAVGSDVICRGTKSIGSVLIGNMVIAGN